MFLPFFLKLSTTHEHEWEQFLCNCDGHQVMRKLLGETKIKPRVIEVNCMLQFLSMLH